MRIFAISDLHVDHAENARWVSQLSNWDYQDDVLICAGDIAHNLRDVRTALTSLRKCFRSVAYVPGNHELWVKPEPDRDSLQKFQEIQRLAAECGAHTGPLRLDSLSLVPVLGWYDYSFGLPSEELLARWADYHMCVWPKDFDQQRITEYFLAETPAFVPEHGRRVISFSHFVPRQDLLRTSGSAVSLLRPVLGSQAIDAHIRKLGSFMHIYGHYHVNQRTERENIIYVNNAFGYPRESYISAKRLVCIVGDE